MSVVSTACQQSEPCLVIGTGFVELIGEGVMLSDSTEACAIACEASDVVISQSESHIIPLVLFNLQCRSVGIAAQINCPCAV